MAVTTLLDIAKANGSDPVVGLIDETSKAHPEIEIVPARTIKGISYKTWVRTTLPVTGFRQANQGGIVDKATYENRLVDTYIFDPRYEADKAVADGYEDGAASYLAHEADAMMESGMQLLCKQFYYGTGNDANGFPGLVAAYNRTLYELNAGGTTASTGNSVWMLKFGEKNIQWVWGMDGQFQMSPVMIQRVTDANNKPYTAYVQECLARPGLQIGSLRGMVRIKNITADAGHTLTDALLAQAMAIFEVGVVPDVILMNRQTRRQLQQSRTVTLFGNGAPNPNGKSATIAPTPTEYDGVPIRVTDSLSTAESLTL